MFYYRAFGLNIESAFELFQLQEWHKPTQGNIDVRINFGAVSAQGINPNTPEATHCQYNNKQLWLNIDKTVRFLIDSGHSITVDVIDETDIQTVKLYLLGSGMGAILQQRGYLVLHGNAIRFGDSAVIAVAQSGVGKSTLAAEFFCRGYELLADDVCAIDPNGHVHPSYPFVKLWQNTIDKLQLEPQKGIQIRLQKEKFYYPLGASFCQQSLPVKAIYILNKAATDKCVSAELMGMNKFRGLQNNRYRALYASKMGIDSQQLESMSAFLKGIHVCRIIRPQDGFQLTELADCLIENVKALTQEVA